MTLRDDNVIQATNNNITWSQYSCFIESNTTPFNIQRIEYIFSHLPISHVQLDSDPLACHTSKQLLLPAHALPLRSLIYIDINSLLYLNSTDNTRAVKCCQHLGSPIVNSMLSGDVSMVCVSKMANDHQNSIMLVKIPGRTVTTVNMPTVNLVHAPPRKLSILLLN